MKLYNFTRLRILIVILLSLTNCKENDITPTNIVLYNKPLKTIQHYIVGKWRLAYSKGGICSTCVHYCDNCFIEFTPDNRVLIPNIDGTYLTDSYIEWVRDIGTYTNNDSTYLMTFKDKQGVPWIYVIERIYNDTLIYHDNSVDAIFYHYVKINH